MIRLSCLIVIAATCLIGCSSTTTATTTGAATGQLATIVPDNPRLRAWDSPLGAAGGHGGQVYLEINGQRLSGMSNRFEVPAGRVSMAVIFRDHQTPVTALMLQTKPVAVAFNALPGHTYRVRGQPFYPPAASRIARTTDTSQYRVVIAVQDADTGAIVHQGSVPTNRIELVDPSTGEPRW